MGNAKSLTGFKKREKFLIFFKQFKKSIQISCIGIFIKIADIAGIFLFFYPCAKRSLRCLCICVPLLKSGKNGSPGRGENPDLFMKLFCFVLKMGFQDQPCTQTVSVTGMRGSSLAIIAAHPDSYDAYMAARVRCSVQGWGALTFAAKKLPLTDLSVIVMILGATS